MYSYLYTYVRTSASGAPCQGHVCGPLSPDAVEYHEAHRWIPFWDHPSELERCR